MRIKKQDRETSSRSCSILESALTLADSEHFRATRGTDAEACAYLYTAALTQPMDHDWTQIYLYIANKVYKTHRQGEVPEDIRVESLRDDQVADLNRLKEWLYRKRTTIRLERDRAERRQKREGAEAKRKAEQPALFDF